MEQKHIQKKRTMKIYLNQSQNSYNIYFLLIIYLSLISIFMKKVPNI